MNVSFFVLSECECECDSSLSRIKIHSLSNCVIDSFVSLGLR